MVNNKAINEKTKEKSHYNGTEGGMWVIFYIMGFIGTVVYEISSATSFLDGFIGFFKAIFWPAILIFEIFKFFGA